tara:strand:- start:533 stop:1843 length:1311 start_codon:yes stop_codon:yes gene_type:complete
MVEILFYNNFPKSYIDDQKLIDVLIKFENSRNCLLEYTVDEIIEFFDQCSKHWMRKSSTVNPIIKQYKLGFIISWLKRKNTKKVFLENLGDLDIYSISQLDLRDGRFVVPKGIVAHWIAGNVPVLGIISLFQGILAKNKNIVKVPKQFKNILDVLLDDISKLEFSYKGRKFFGNDFIQSILLLYIDKEDFTNQSAISKIADVRVAWGGKEAIESILNLPKKITATDVVFGPKVSLAVISKENLVELNDIQSVAEKLCKDIVTFDQYGCNAPHNLFIEKDKRTKTDIFLKCLAESFEKYFLDVEVVENNWADCYSIMTKRFIYTVSDEKEAIISNDLKWSIFYDKQDNRLNDPVYGRSIFVKEVNDITDIYDIIPPNIQSVGVCIHPDRLKQFIFDVSYKGAYRFPSIGHMSLYENPWDGILPISRMVNWISFERNS